VGTIHQRALTPSSTEAPAIGDACSNQAKHVRSYLEQRRRARDQARLSTVACGSLHGVHRGIDNLESSG